MVALTCFGITLPSSGSVRSAFERCSIEEQSIENCGLAFGVLWRGVWRSQIESQWKLDFPYPSRTAVGPNQCPVHRISFVGAKLIAHPHIAPKSQATPSGPLRWYWLLLHLWEVPRSNPCRNTDYFLTEVIPDISEHLQKNDRVVLWVRPWPLPCANWTLSYSLIVLCISIIQLQLLAASLNEINAIHQGLVIITFVLRPSA
jgi:hypothetical protein